MKQNLRTNALFALLAAAAAVAPRPAEALARPIRFERLSLDEGLSQAAVMDVLQDKRGYVWMATEDGLNRYDGNAFKVYRHDATDDATLPDGFVWDIEEDGAGSVWVATRGGLGRWDRATDKVVRQATGAVRNIRVVRYQQKGNALWIGTRDSGLLRLDLASNKIDRFAHDGAAAGSLVDDRVYTVYVDPQDRLWVGTEGGLDLLNADGRTFTHHVPSESDAASLSDARIRAVLSDDKGGLWVGTTGGGLNRMDVATGKVERFGHGTAPDSLANDDVRALLLDANGRLWVGTSGGLDLFDADRRSFAHYRQDPGSASSLSDDHVLSLTQDRGGVIWVGTRMGGVHKWNPLSWQFGHVAPEANNPKGLGGGRVTGFSEDRAGTLWIATYGAGLYAQDRTTGDMKAYRHDDRDARSLPSDQVMTLRHDHRGDLWIGTLDAGLVRMSRADGTFKAYSYDAKKPEGLGARGVTAILEDADHLLWVGTYGGGLERFDPATGRFTHFRHDADDEASLSGDRVATLSEAADGRLWVATMETGLDLLDPRSGRFQHFRHRAGDGTSLPSDAIHSLYVDVAGALWVGSHSGLSQLQPDGKSFKTYSTRNGLPSDVVYAIANDRQGRLWLSTNNGLAAFDPRTGQSVNYGVSNGLQAREYNLGAWFQSTSGELFFGGLNGFNAFVPDRIRQLAQPPQVVLTGVNVDHRPLGGGPADETQSIRLGFRDKVLGLEFAALDFTAPDRNLFAYKLDGFDPDWVPLRGKRSVTYTNLNPGKYTFQLRGANSDGRWNDQPLAVPVSVDAPPWATPWAFTGYTAFLVMGLVGVTRSQKRKFEREAEYARVLEFRVQERTRELSMRQVDLEKANDELARASITDSLTGLANRRFLTEYIEKEVALLHRRYNRLNDGPITADLLDLAFMMIDLDRFKTINDSAGHAAGDVVLRDLRDLLVSCSRTSDIIVRWGGDEFLLVARDLSGDGLLELAERVRARVAAHVFEIGEGRVVRTTCSIGFACYPFFREQLDALSWEQVISVADRALYVAKASGRNAWVGFHPGITALPIQGLFGSICHGAQQLVREGTLRVTSSLTGVRSLVWEVADQEKAANG